MSECEGIYLEEAQRAGLSEREIGYRWAKYMRYLSTKGWEPRIDGWLRQIAFALQDMRESSTKDGAAKKSARIAAAAARKGAAAYTANAVTFDEWTRLTADAKDDPVRLGDTLVSWYNSLKSTPPPPDTKPEGKQSPGQAGSEDDIPF